MASARWFFTRSTVAMVRSTRASTGHPRRGRVEPAPAPVVDHLDPCLPEGLGVEVALVPHQHARRETETVETEGQLLDLALGAARAEGFDQEHHADGGPEGVPHPTGAGTAASGADGCRRRWRRYPVPNDAQAPRVIHNSLSYWSCLVSPPSSSTMIAICQ